MSNDQLIIPHFKIIFNMKDFILVIYLALLSVLSTAQPQFAPLGAKWYYHEQGCNIFGNGEPWERYTVREVVKDTIIDGKYCTLIESNYCAILSSCDWRNYVYQEGSKVFIYDGALGRFQMLYDFSLQAGESYGLRVCSDSWLTDSILLTVESASGGPNGVQDIIINPVQGDNWSDLLINVQNGVGSLGDNPVFRFPPCVTFEDPCYQIDLLCYETPESGVISIDGSPCISNSISIPKQENLSTIELFPNPASNQITIINNHPTIQNLQIGLFSSTGQKVKDWHVAKGQEMVSCNISELSSGLYFWAASLDGSVVESGKLIVSR